MLYFPHIIMTSHMKISAPRLLHLDPFNGSEEEAVTDNSMSLTALDAEDWVCS